MNQDQTQNMITEKTTPRQIWLGASCDVPFTQRIPFLGLTVSLGYWEASSNHFTRWHLTIKPHRCWSTSNPWSILRTVHPNVSAAVVSKLPGQKGSPLQYQSVDLLWRSIDDTQLCWACSVRKMGDELIERRKKLKLNQSVSSGDQSPTKFIKHPTLHRTK